MRCVIVTGMSGAGKSTVLKFLEDIGYFCVDNLPPSLISKFIDLCSTPNSNMANVAIGVDIRGGSLLGDLANFLSEIKTDENKSFEILYLDSENEVLLKRYKESRRQHPLNIKGERLIDGIKSEKKTA